MLAAAAPLPVRAIEPLVALDWDAFEDWHARLLQGLAGLPERDGWSDAG